MGFPGFPWLCGGGAHFNEDVEKRERIIELCVMCYVWGEFGGPWPIFRLLTQSTSRSTLRWWEHDWVWWVSELQMRCSDWIVHAVGNTVRADNQEPIMKMNIIKIIQLIKNKQTTKHSIKSKKLFSIHNITSIVFTCERDIQHYWVHFSQMFLPDISKKPKNIMLHKTALLWQIKVETFAFQCTFKASSCKVLHHSDTDSGLSDDIL